MSDATYTITFPMVMAGLLTVGGTVLAFFVKKWLADSERAQEKQEAETHESFKLLHARIDKLRDQRDDDLKARHALELELATMVKREELNLLYERMDALHQEVIRALATRGGQ